MVIQAKVTPLGRWGDFLEISGVGYYQLGLKDTGLELRQIFTPTVVKKVERKVFLVGRLNTFSGVKMVFKGPERGRFRSPPSWFVFGDRSVETTQEKSILEKEYLSNASQLSTTL